MDGVVASRFVMHENKNGDRWMVPALRSAIEYFWEGCQELGGANVGFRLATVLYGACVWVWQVDPR